MSNQFESSAQKADQEDRIGQQFFGNYGDEYDEAVAASQEYRPKRAAAAAEWQSVSTEARRIVVECGLTRKVERADDDFAMQSTYEYWVGVAADGGTLYYQYMTMQGCKDIIRDYKAGKLVAKTQAQNLSTLATYAITDKSGDSRKHWISVARSMGYTCKMYGAEMQYAKAPDGTILKNYNAFIAHLAKTIEVNNG